MDIGSVVEVVLAVVGLLLTTVAFLIHAQALAVFGIVLTAVTLGFLLSNVLGRRGGPGARGT